MTKKYRKMDRKPYSRRVVFHTSNPEQRELFLELGMELLKDEVAKVDTRLDRIELELFGNQDRVEGVVQRLYELETRIFQATNPDGNSRYQYHPELLNRLFKPTMNIRLWSHLLRIHDFETEIVDRNRISTTADLARLQELHKNSLSYLSALPTEHHKDIQRFLLGVALETGVEDYHKIIEQALEHNILAIHQDELHFAIAQQNAHNRLVDLFSTQETIEFDEATSELSIEDLLFEGGKIVFMRDGQEIDETELDHRSYDGEEEK